MNKYLKSLLLGLVILPVGVNAATVTMSLDCPSSANANAEVSCSIKATPNGSDLRGLQSNFDISGATYLSFDLQNGWTVQGSGISELGMVLSRGTPANATVSVGNLKVKMPNEGTATIKLTNISAVDSSYATLNGSTESDTIRVKSSVNTLDSLILTGAEISFDKSKTQYDVTIDASSTTVSAIKTDQYSTVSGTGEKTLKYGKNTFNIVVAAENGSKKTYTINVTRPDNRSTNNNLKSLNLTDSKITFNKNTTSYNVEVDSSLTKIEIKAELEDDKASFVKNYGPRSVNLNYGKNTVLIKVKSENEKEKVYTLNIIRKDGRSSNTNLSNITLSSGTLVFNKDLTEYQIPVENDVEEIKITAIAEDKKAKVEVVESKKLEIGNNEIKIKVTAENKDTKEYKVIIIRKEKNQVLDSNNYLKSINITGYDIAFNKEKLSYDLTIKEEEKLEIQVFTESEKAIATVVGNEQLKNGSIIKISVTSESGEIKEYRINIAKSVEENESDSLLYIAIGVFAVGLVSFVGSVIYKKNKKEQ